MPKGSISTRQRRQVAERAGRRCEYCLSPADYAPDPFAVEHIVPRVRGGKSHLSNLAYSWQACNNHKYIHTEALDPVSGETVPLYDPRRHQWRDHFTWNEDSVRVVGLTPIGRTAIDRLRLNRPSVVNLRRLLLAVGQHPPRETLEDSQATALHDQIREVNAGGFGRRSRRGRLRAVRGSAADPGLGRVQVGETLLVAEAADELQADGAESTGRRGPKVSGR